jgi:hypothetical protein
VIKSYHIYIFCLLLVIVGYNTKAQTYNKSLWSYGGFVDYIIANHITDFSALPGVPNCCPKFTGGTGTGFSIGGLFQYRFYVYNHFLLRAGYQQLSGDLSAQESEWIVMNDKLTSALIEHKISTKFTMFFLEPTYKYNTNIGLSFSLGMNASILTNSTYSQQEMLIKPENSGTFETGTRIRNVQSGTLTGTEGMIFFALLVAEYEIYLDKYRTNILTPRFSFNYGLNSMFRDEKWRITYFSFGISYKYNPFYETSSPLEPKRP